MSLLEKIRVTQAFLESKGIEKPEFGLILGSGLGELAEEVEDAVVIDGYSKLGTINGCRSCWKTCLRNFVWT